MIGDSPLWENAIVEDLNDPRFARWGMIRARAGRAQALAAVRRARRLAGRTHPQPVRRQYAKADPGPHAGPRAGLHRGRPAHLGPGHRRRGLCARAAAAARRRRAAGVRGPEEIFALADRIAVLCGGKLVDVKPVAQWTPASVGLAMTGTRAWAGHARRALPTHHRANIRMKLLRNAAPSPAASRWRWLRRGHPLHPGGLRAAGGLGRRAVGRTYALLFEGAFGSRFALSETLTRATPLMLTGRPARWPSARASTTSAPRASCTWARWRPWPWAACTTAPASTCPCPCCSPE